MDMSTRTILAETATCDRRRPPAEDGETRAPQGPGQGQEAVYAPPAWQMDPANVARVGVYCGGALYVYEHHDPRARPGAYAHAFCRWDGRPDRQGGDLAALAEVAHRLKCGAVWLIPARGARPAPPADDALVADFQAAARRLLADPPAAHVWGELSSPRATGLVGLRCQRRGPDGRGAGPILQVIAAWQDAWALAGKLALLPEGDPEARAGAVARGVALAAYALGAQLRYSPSYTGLSILRATLRGMQQRGMVIPPLSDEWRDRLMTMLPTPLQWARAIVAPDDLDPATVAPDAPVVIRKYDRISSYVASAAEVPCGDPVPTGTSYHAHRPGVYRVEARAPAGWDARTPGPFAWPADGADADADGACAYPAPTDHALQVWAWEPQVRLAVERGWDVRVLEGYWWPKAADGHPAGTRVRALLRPWQERVWGARRACEREPDVSGALARAIVKRAGVATIGRLLQRRGVATMTRERARDEHARVLSRVVDEWGNLTGMVQTEAALGRSDLVWPHVWGHIISLANERLLHATYAHAPTDTIALYVDAAYMLRPVPELAAGERLGHYRLERMIVLRSREEVAAYGAAAAQGAQAAVKWLAHHGEAVAPAGEAREESEESEESEGAADGEGE